MPSLAELQADIARAVLAAGAPPRNVEHQIAPNRLPAERQLNIHRNNCRAALVDGLVEVFPLGAAFVGLEFLRGALHRFVVASPPHVPVLHQYGGAFAEFLAGFAPAQSVPYLADLVRLDWAVHELQHCLATERTIASAYPLYDLWRAGVGTIEPETVSIDDNAQTVRIVVDGDAVRVQRIA